ncbi:MAG: hypothetical protein MUO78_04380 [candidate division Zixibacteria bacterium]|nr:hypothetical protein [candidate division Zixibacteria bacterium]
MDGIRWMLGIKELVETPQNLLFVRELSSRSRFSERIPARYKLVQVTRIPPEAEKSNSRTN